MTARDATPHRLDAVLTELLGAGNPPTANPLRLANHGQNAPLVAQVAHLLIRALPREVACYPGSREFRTAMRAYLGAQSIVIEPTRTDLRAGVAWLARHDLLPAWVYPGDRFGGDCGADAR